MLKKFFVILAIFQLCSCFSKGLQFSDIQNDLWKTSFKNEKRLISFTNTESLSGDILWKYQLKSSPANNFVAGYGYIFLPLENHQLLIFNADSGKMVKRIFTDFFITDITLSSEKIYLTGLGEWNSIIGYDLRSMDKLFNKSADPLGGKILYTEKGLLYLTNQGKLFSIDNLTGKIKLQKNISGLNSGFSTDGKNIIISYQQGYINIVDIDDFNKIQKVELNEKLESFAILDDNIYQISLNGNLFVISYSGDIISTIKLEGDFINPILIKDNIIYCVSKDGNIYAVNKDNLEIVLKNTIDYPIVSPPILFGDDLIICNLVGNVLIIDTRTLNVKKEIKLDSMIKIQPIIYNNMVYVVTNNGFIYCIK